MNNKLKWLYDQIIPEEYADFVIEEGNVNATKLHEIIEKLNINPVTAVKNSKYSVYKNNHKSKKNIQTSSLFTKFLLLVDLIMKVSNIYKYFYTTGYKAYLITIYNLLTIKFININYNDLIFNVIPAHALIDIK